MDSKITAMVLMDLGKAFESHCYTTLLKKFKCITTTPSIYLNKREQRTGFANVLSEPLTVTHGVPQGWILWPMLITLYKSDLHNSVKLSKIESYVDDTKIYLSFATKDQDGCPQFTHLFEKLLDRCPCDQINLLSY